MKKLLLCLFLVLFCSSCAKYMNTVKRDGGVLGSYAGDWIIISKSGGLITDVWKVKNTMVQSESGSDGWLWTDESGNVFNVSGDVKAIRIMAGDMSKIWNLYVEYHNEFDNCSYMEKYTTEGNRQ